MISLLDTAAILFYAGVAVYYATWTSHTRLAIMWGVCSLLFLALSLSRRPHMTGDASNYPPFHLSVNGRGIVSLWDHEASAQHQKGETYVRLELTTTQVEALRRAQRTAQRSQ